MAPNLDSPHTSPSLDRFALPPANPSNPNPPSGTSDQHPDDATSSTSNIPRTNFVFLRETLREAAAAPLTSGPISVAIRAWAPGTVSTYIAHLKPLALLHARKPALTHIDVLTTTLQDMAVHSRSAAAARGLLSAVRQLETLGLLPPTVNPMHWAMARALTSIASPAPPQLWATTDLLLYLAHKSSTSVMAARTVILAFLSFSHLLRIGEASSMRLQDITRTILAFLAEKRSPGWFTCPVGPWAKAWSARL